MYVMGIDVGITTGISVIREPGDWYAVSQAVNFKDQGTDVVLQVIKGWTEQFKITQLAVEYPLLIHGTKLYRDLTTIVTSVKEFLAANQLMQNFTVTEVRPTTWKQVTKKWVPRIPAVDIYKNFKFQKLTTHEKDASRIAFWLHGQLASKELSNAIRSQFLP